MTAQDDTQAHYEKLLAPIYSWMLGDPAQAFARSKAQLTALGVSHAPPGASALDLGAGTGLQSIPLAELGYRVTAVDSSGELLAELSVARPDVEVVTGDLVRVNLRSSYALIVCMGDTLTHLASFEDVDRVLADSARRLAPGGRLLLTFRDYVSAERQGTERFIPVRSDADRILTCCLDFGVDRVTVTDIVHERHGDQWTLRASDYEKLRLAPERVRDRLESSGLVVERCDVTAGLVTVVARAA